MISWKHKFIFIHVPKCAGTTIFEALKNHHNNYTGHELTPFMKKQIKSGRFYVFTCVRNPWDRTVSNYEFAKTKKTYWHSDDKSTRYGIHPNYNVVKDMTFDQYIKSIQTKSLPSNYQTRSQYSWIKPYIKNVDCIMKLETLDEDFKTFCDRKDIQATLPHVNSTSHARYVDYYTDNKLINIVADIYRDDILKFNYTFD